MIPQNETFRQDLAKVAREYIARGYAPIPVPFGQKAVTREAWQQLRIVTENVGAYFNGHPQNIGLLLGEPSGGLVDIDLDASETVMLANWFLPQTPSRFGRKSRPISHRLYAVDPIIPTKKFQDVDGKMLVEFRSTGTQTLVPPSVADDEVRFWDEDGAPTRLAAWDLFQDVSRLAAAALVARHWPATGSRHDASLALAGGLLRAGWSDRDTRTFIEAVARCAGDDEVEDRVKSVETSARTLDRGDETTGFPRLIELLQDGEKVVKKLREWLRIKEGVLPDTSRPGGRPCTDLGNAERLVDQFGEDILYSSGSWLVWTGTHWQRDVTEAAVKRYAMQAVRGIYQEAEKTDDRMKRPALARHAASSERAERINAMVSLARTLCEVDSERFDQNPWLLNVRNGTVDLRTGELREHQREDYITQFIDLPYDPDAPCPRWMQFLEEVQPIPENRALLHRAAGYSATGSARERVIIIVYGTGRNGKGKFLQRIKDVLGPYALRAMNEALIQKPNDNGPRPEVVQLRGKRFVFVSETKERGQLNVAQVKDLTGGEEISARTLHKEPTTFKPTFTPWLATNHKPVIHEGGDAIWDRLRLVPFSVRFRLPEEPPDGRPEADVALDDKLLYEHEGILAWIVRGAVDWYRNGLGVSTSVREATDEYRRREDHVWTFLHELFEPGSKSDIVESEAVYDAYLRWCSQNDTDAWSRRKFIARIEDYGYSRRRRSHGMVFVGIRIRQLTS